MGLEAGGLVAGSGVDGRKSVHETRGRRSGRRQWGRWEEVCG
jgi:hypothetical protein